MRFAILKAGSASRPIRETLGDFDRMFLDLLAEPYKTAAPGEAAPPGETWDVIDVEHGQRPADVYAYDGYVITGSRASAYEDLPWIHGLLDLLRQLHAQQRRVLGICFGHQCLAQALGGEVRRLEGRWHLGVDSLELTPTASSALTDSAQPALRAAPQPLRILKLHGDIVTRLPPGAEALATRPAGGSESFRIGEHVLTLQGHPEFQPAVIEDAVQRLLRAGEITARMAQDFRATLAQPPHREFLRAWLRGFLTQEPLAQTAAARACN